MEFADSEAVGVSAKAINYRTGFFWVGHKLLCAFRLCLGR